MTAQHTRRWPLWAFLGAAGLALVLGGFLLFGPTSKQAQGGEPRIEGAAYQTTEKLLLSITVTRTGDEKLRGTLHTELVGPDDRVVASKQTKINQDEETE